MIYCACINADRLLIYYIFDKSKLILIQLWFNVSYRSVLSNLIRSIYVYKNNPYNNMLRIVIIIDHYGELQKFSRSS